MRAAQAAGDGVNEDSQKQHFQGERQQAQNRKMLHHQVQSQMMV